MNKTDLINTLAKKLSDRSAAQKSVEEIVQIIRDCLRSGEKVVLSEIGSLTPKIRKAQNRHNPNTMQPVYVPAKRTVKFTLSKDLFK